MADSSTSSTVQSGEPAAIVRKGVAIAGIQVSVKKSEAHTYTSQATELAMESGATVTDHVILKPVTLAVTVAHDQRRRRKGRGEGCVRVFRGDAEGP